MFVSFGCSKGENEHKLLCTVNGQSIYFSDLDFAKLQYEDSEISEPELIAGLVKEEIVLQYFEKSGEKIEDVDVENQFKSLKNVSEDNVFYEKAIEIYGSESKIKEAIEYRLMYNRAKKILRNDFANMLIVDNRKLEIRAEEFISKSEPIKVSNDDFSEYKDSVMKQYNEAMVDEIFDLYFHVWLNQQVEKSDVEFAPGIDNPFYEKTLSLKDGKIFYQNEELFLNEIPLVEAQEVYGNLLYLSDKFKEYDELKISGVHKTSEKLKALNVNYIDKISGISVDVYVITSPEIDYAKESVITVSSMNGVNTVEYVLTDIGIKYSISSEMKSNDLKDILMDMIPYQFLHVSN